MKVNKRSWHYNLWRKYGGFTYANVSLCSYVQRLFWVSLFAAAGVAVMAVCVGVIVSGLVVATITHPVVVGCVVLGCAIYVSTMRPPWSNFLFRQHTIKGPQGLVASWVKAKKEKVCPLIDFED